MPISAVNLSNTQDILTIETPIDFSSSEEGFMPVPGTSVQGATYQRKNVHVIIDNQQYDDFNFTLNLQTGSFNLRSATFGNNTYFVNSPETRFNRADARRTAANMYLLFIRSWRSMRNTESFNDDSRFILQLAEDRQDDWSQSRD